MRRLFGAAAIAGEPVLRDEETEPRTGVYEGDPARSLAILWREVKGDGGPLC